MLQPSMNELLRKIPNRYMIVNIAAHRARIIAQEAEDAGDYLDDKPVSLALEEIAEGRLHLEKPAPHLQDSSEG
jgi:DNA-directed RNA polymerase subunit omega